MSRPRGWVVAGLVSCSVLAQGKNSKPVLEDDRGRLRSLARQEKSLHRELLDHYRRSEKLKAEIAALEARKNDFARRTRQTDVFLSDLSHAVGKKQRELFAALRAWEMRLDPAALELFFSARSAEDFLYQRAIFAQWGRYQSALFSSYRDEFDSLVGRKEGLLRNQSDLAKVLIALERKKAEMAADQRDRVRLLSMVQSQKEYYADSIREQESASRDLQRMLEGMGNSQTRPSRFQSMRGKLLFPVRGRIERTYGSYTDARLKTVVYHKGIDFRAAAGTPVRSVFDGKVVYADWFVGYGKIVIVEHDPEYFSLYAHLSAIDKRVGDPVVVGETIGRVGDSGSIQGPYLYFEMRKKGISEDPMPWFLRSNPKTRRSR